MKLDPYDLKILAALQEHGRMINQDLAELIFLSPSATLNRVRRLENEGVISGYQALITPQKSGDMLSAYLEVTLENHYPKDFEAFDQYINNLEYVVSGHKVSGRFDYLLYVIVKNMPALSKLSNELLESEVNIAKLVTVPVIDEVKLFKGVSVSLLSPDT